MSTPAAMIGRLDMHRASHGAEVAALVKVGATLWNISSRPEGVHAPTGGRRSCANEKARFERALIFDHELLSGPRYGKCSFAAVVVVFSS
ncbi:hypothetical protein J2W24_006240 [Variovorax boronicumulans]|uniref:hypothetical protein n=1 Tax=Variovorax boronicumulans TaxID=436515 RepID=UPI00278AE19D|nr:hypothetical protein [Variovorax boronicumulans]MDP9920558.1 hypothetical protein [Variovorax boronicumulans]